VSKIILALVTATAAISTSTLPSRALEQPIVDTIYRPAVDGNPLLQVHTVCSHFYNGSWHYRQHCYWVPDHNRHNRWWQS
jgi:hypothetical protein